MSRTKTKPKSADASPTAVQAVNRARGVTLLQVGGKTYRLAMTMNALAEIEDALQVDSLPDVEAALGKAGTRQMGAVLAALINAGEGKPTITAEECRRLPLTIPQFSAALISALSASGAMSDDEASDEGN